MRKILITGGAGFIGSHVAEKIACRFPDAEIVILDKMTYAADGDNLSGVLQRHKRRLVVGDICDLEMCDRLTKNMDCVVHLAAESHVDNSFGNSLQFTRSNTLGTHTLLEASRINNVPLFIHISTDEVYGEIDSGSFTEDSVLNPSNPYSGSKAGAEMIVSSYRQSYDMPIITVRSNNIFGIRQYPEKIIPKFIMQAISGLRFTLHGDGKNRRRYLAAEDFAEAVVLLLGSGKVGDIYNIGSVQEYSNLEIAEMIAAHFDLEPQDSMEFVADRPFNDSRYAVDTGKISSLGWSEKRNFEKELPRIVEWYRDNADRYSHLF